MCYDNHGKPRVIPFMCKRERIIAEMHSTLGNVGLERLYQALSSIYHWQHMKEDMHLYVQRHPARQRKFARPTLPAQLYPIFKGIRTFMIWVLDCITGLKPPSPEGYTAVLVIIDPFSKWVEAWPIKGLNSEEITRIFHWHIMCHFGKPSVVCTDGGPEFRGAFVDYTTLYGIRHRHISAYNARAVG